MAPLTTSDALAYKEALSFLKDLSHSDVIRMFSQEHVYETKRNHLVPASYFSQWAPISEAWKSARDRLFTWIANGKPASISGDSIMYRHTIISQRFETLFNRMEHRGALCVAERIPALERLDKAIRDNYIVDYSAYILSGPSSPDIHLAVDPYCATLKKPLHVKHQGTITNRIIKVDAPTLNLHLSWFAARQHLYKVSENKTPKETAIFFLATDTLKMYLCVEMLLFLHQSRNSVNTLPWTLSRRLEKVDELRSAFLTDAKRKKFLIKRTLAFLDYCMHALPEESIFYRLINESALDYYAKEEYVQNIDKAYFVGFSKKRLCTTTLPLITGLIQKRYRLNPQVSQAEPDDFKFSLFAYSPRIIIIRGDAHHCKQLKEYPIRKRNRELTALHHAVMEMKSHGNLIP